MEGGAWCARDISLRAQKKFLSRVGGAASARALVLDEHAAKLLDQSVSRLAGVFAIASRGELLDALFAGQVDEDVLKLSRMLRKELDRGLL
ncbi:hypothetical protein HF086_001959 [Spodoptera exigua]|uniref:Uncharacterized protein n=1 Tax=Spodoptera exigua TaxID=7107 RepID=A0A922MQJ0_SPOEX|nr:hypothetical protein HF086_001959 [Spodoptera exigua]